MAAPSAPQGINSALLASMDSHNHVASSLGIGGSGAVGLENKIGSEMQLDQFLKPSIPGIGGPSVDEAFLGSVGGVFGQDPLNIFDGNFFSPGNVNALQGIGSIEGSGNIKLENVGLKEQLNAPQTVPGLLGRGQEASH